MTLEKSPLIRVLGTQTSTNIFRCPLDRDDKDRITLAQAGDGPYYYSYEFTSFNINGTVSPGFTTIIDLGNQAHYFKTSQVRSPSTKIMCVEPVASLNRNDAPSFDTTWVVQSGRWEAFTADLTAVHNYLTLRHNKKSDAGFADGHVQAVSQQYATNLMYLLP